MNFMVKYYCDIKLAASKLPQLSGVLDEALFISARAEDAAVTGISMMFRIIKK